MKHLRVKLIESWQEEGYLDQLARALGNEGVDVIGPDQTADYDVLHLHAPQYRWKSSSRVGGFARWMRFMGTLLACKAQGKKIVWTAHDLADPANPPDLLSLLADRVMARSSDAIICHGDTPKNTLLASEKVAARKINVLPHPSFSEIFPNHLGKVECRQVLGIPPSVRRVYLLLGNVRPYKGARRFLEAFERVARSDSLFLVAGTPEHKGEVAYLESRAKTDGRLKVLWGQIPGQLLQVYFNAADVAVFPYEHITTSGAAILAMSFGLPVIASDLNCLGEVVEPEGGFKFDPAAPGSEGLDACLSQCELAPDVDLARMGDFNRKKVSAWTWPGLARDTRALYESLLEPQPELGTEQEQSHLDPT